MKLITFTVPCFNSAACMRKCIESLVVGGEDVEIVIVNDGSTEIRFPSPANMKRHIPLSCVSSTKKTAGTVRV